MPEQNEDSGTLSVCIPVCISVSLFIFESETGRIILAIYLQSHESVFVYLQYEDAAQ